MISGAEGGSVSAPREPPEGGTTNFFDLLEVAAAETDKDKELVSAAQVLVKALKNTPDGKNLVAKYPLDIKNSQVGAIGDNVQVEGGIHFGNK